jgi:hypothetical protein
MWNAGLRLNGCLFDGEMIYHYANLCEKGDIYGLTSAAPIHAKGIRSLFLTPATPFLEIQI